MIKFDAVDFSERCSEEVMFLLMLSVDVENYLKDIHSHSSLCQVCSLPQTSTLSPLGLL